MSSAIINYEYNLTIHIIYITPGDRWRVLYMHQQTSIILIDNDCNMPFHPLHSCSPAAVSLPTDWVNWLRQASLHGLMSYIYQYASMYLIARELWTRMWTRRAHLSHGKIGIFCTDKIDKTNNTKYIFLVDLHVPLLTYAPGLVLIFIIKYR